MCEFQVDAMLQKLEKEIDDVDAKIGDRWRLLDRFVNCLFSGINDHSIFQTNNGTVCQRALAISICG